MKSLYTDIQDIKGEIEKRQSDPKLIEEIFDYYKKEIGINPPFWFNLGNLFLTRQLPVLRVETLYGKVLAEQLGLDFSVATYVDDRFVTCSKEKYSYVRPHFIEDSSPTFLIEKSKINHLDKKKKKLSQIFLEDSTSLFDYHKNLLTRALGSAVTTFDMNGGFNKKQAKDYYKGCLVLFGGLNCLLENYHDFKNEKPLKKFTQEIVEPAFEDIKKTLGLKPLIVQLPDIKDSDKYVSSQKSAENIINQLKERYLR